MGILIGIVCNAVALYVTTLVVPGIAFTGSLPMLLLAGLILGLFNLIVRPIAMLLALPLLIITLGLFYFVMNGLLLWPFSEERLFAPWRPLPVAPIGSRFWSERGLRVAATELAWFLPLLVWTGWPRKRSASLPSSS